MTSRRRFISLVPLLGAAALARAQAPAPLVDPKDPQAMALGYSADATKVDKAKYPKYAAGQACGSCALYQGKAGDASGPVQCLGEEGLKAALPECRRAPRGPFLVGARMTRAATISDRRAGSWPSSAGAG